MVNSDRVYQNIITHPWGAKGAKVRGWVIVVSGTGKADGRINAEKGEDAWDIVARAS